MRFVNATELRQILTVADTYKVVEDAYRHYGAERRVTSNPSASYTLVQSQPPVMVWMKGAQIAARGVAGVFFGAQFGDYYFAVLDGRQGTMKGMIEQAWLTKRRTAVTGCVTLQKLARPGAKVAALVGAGQIAEEVARCLPHGFDLTDFRVASRTPEGAQKFVDRLKPDVNAPIRAVASAEEAVRGADIVVTITLATEPIVKPGWLAEGATLVSMGGVPEVEFDVLDEVGKLVVDDLDYALLRGDLANWIASGRISQEDMLARVDADIGEIVSGIKTGRTDPSERIVAIIQGMAVCDLALAMHVLEQAEAQGVGQTLVVTPQMVVPETDLHSPRSQFIAQGLDNRRPRASVR